MPAKLELHTMNSLESFTRRLKPDAAAFDRGQQFVELLQDGQEQSPAMAQLGLVNDEGNIRAENGLIVIKPFPHVFRTLQEKQPSSDAFRNISRYWVKAQFVVDTITRNPVLEAEINELPVIGYSSEFTRYVHQRDRLRFRYGFDLGQHAIAIVRHDLA
jgi:hypothetical protein